VSQEDVAILRGLAQRVLASTWQPLDTYSMSFRSMQQAATGSQKKCFLVGLAHYQHAKQKRAANKKLLVT